MKTKTNKEIIEEFRERFVDKDKKYIVDYIDGKMVLGADIEKFILQALDQKEREVREEIVEEIENIKNTQCKSDYHNPDDVGGFYCGCLTTTCDHILSNLKQPKE